MLVSSFLLLGSALSFNQVVQGWSAPVRRDTATADAQSSNCGKACALLSTVLQGKVFFPSSSTYAAEEVLYWSQQQSSQTPTCRVAPASAADVSTALKILTAVQCQFAVKSGGHASFQGASNIDGAVAIDLLNMKTLTISADRKQVSVGTGLRWGQIYSQLDKVNLTVIGGRNSDIGAGGLTLGGGISYFSGLHGWACDNVNNYEVVFADGSINNVSYKSFPDLYNALRGGGNNFGIVTRLDLASYDQGKMWGGAFNYAQDTMPALISAFYDFNINHYQDPSAAVILAYVWLPTIGYLGSVDLEYAKPISDPPILKNFTDIPNLSNSGRITNLTDLTIELAATQPDGSRETFWACMAHNDEKLLNDVQHIFESEVTNIMNVTDVLPALVFQPISTAMTSHFTQNGGNALGITAADGPLVLINTSVKWTSTGDDALIMTFAQNFINRTVALSKQRGLWHRYIYQNYAAIQQDVFTGYGPVSKAKLVATHKKYDPNNVFTRLQPGYFKIN